MAGYMQTAGLVCYFVILFGFYTNANEYEDEYKDLNQNKEVISEKDWVSVTSDGNVMPFHWNPAERDFLNEKPIEIIPKKKIVGGKDSNPGAVPYIVNQIYNNKIFCGGSIYNSVTILTAAHCFHGNNAKLEYSMVSQFTYVAGEFIMGVEEGHEQKRKSVKIVIHPNYLPSKSFFDIAIVTVDKPFVYDKYVQPIPIDRPPVVPENVGKAHISGWGYTLQRSTLEDYSRKYFPSKLQEAKVRVFTKNECYGFYAPHKNLKPLNRVSELYKIAGHEKGNVDGCQGDSGGPLACYNPAKGNRRYLCGIVATGVGCGLPGMPGFYTRVAQFHDWVISHSGYADKRTIDDTRETI